VWMAENLNYKIDGSWCYDDDETNGKKYGRLYTWDTAKVACPNEWHLPSRQEWDDLVTAAGGEKVAGKKLKASSGWNGNGNGADEFGFSALPGGFRNSDGSFDTAGEFGVWWTATEYPGGSNYAYLLDMNDNGDDVYESYNDDEGGGYSMRCVKDGYGRR